ncbi:hypothetical protein OAC13_01660 [bacterium]|nr:hypothetical protein [bacterium]
MVAENSSSKDESMKLLIFIELASKVMLFGLSITVAKTYGGDKLIDLFAWSIFLFATLHGWFLGTLDYTIVPILAGFSKEARNAVGKSIILLTCCILLILISFIFPNFKLIFNFLTSFSPELVSSFSDSFLYLCIYFFASSVFSVFESILNQKKIYLIPAALKGIVNPLLIMIFIYFQQGSIETYAIGYFSSFVVILCILLLSAYKGRENKQQGYKITQFQIIKILSIRGYPLLIASILNSVGEILLRYFLSGFSPGSFFYYSLAQKLALMINSVFGQTIIKYGFTEVCDTIVSDKESRNKVYWATMRCIYIYGCAVTFFVFVISKTLITLVYSGGTISPQNTQLVLSIFQILILGILPTAFHAFNWKFLSYLNLTKIGMYLALPVTILSGLAYYWAQSPVELARTEIFLCLINFGFYSAYVFKKANLILSVRDYLFILYVPAMCVLGLIVFYALRLVCSGSEITFLFLASLIFIPMVYFLVSWGRKICPFAFSDFRSFNPQTQD